MPIVGTFEADFSQFVAAVRDGERALRGLTEQSTRVVSSVDNIGTTLAKIGTAFGVTFTTAAVVQFGRELLRTADELEKLSDRTGLSVQALQRFRLVGDDVGNTVGEISAAIVQMQNRLVGGDTSAVKAFDDLGLSVSNMKRLSPEAQFIAISDALRQIEDPSRQVNLAMDVFGRTGANVLPTLKRGFDDVKDSVVGMSDEAVATLDAAGDALTRFGRAVQANVGELVAANLSGVMALNFLLTDQGKQLEEVTAQAAKLAPTMAGILPPGLPEDLKQIEKGLTEDAEAAMKLNKAADEAREKLEELQKTAQEHIHAIGDSLFSSDDIKRATDYAEAIGRIENVSNLSVEAQEEFVEVMRKGVEAMILTGRGTDELTELFEDLRLEALRTGREAAEAFKRWEASLDGVIAKALALQRAMVIPGLSITGGASPLNATGTVSFGSKGEMITGGGSQFVPGSGVTVFGGGEPGPAALVHPSITSGIGGSGGTVVNMTVSNSFLNTPADTQRFGETVGHAVVSKLTGLARQVS